MLLLLTQSVTTLAFQWQQADDAGFTINVASIAGQTDFTQLPEGGPLLGKWVRLRVIATDDGGSTTAFSNILGPVAPAAIATEMVGAVPI